MAFTAHEIERQQREMQRRQKEVDARSEREIRSLQRESRQKFIGTDDEFKAAWPSILNAIRTTKVVDEMTAGNRKPIADLG